MTRFTTTLVADKARYPELYERVRAAVQAGQLIPEGSTWVEPDTNIPSGESLIRQFIHGKRFFKDEFGVDCELMWLPDVFGYSGAMPQSMTGCGCKYFSTQKIFWAYNSDVTYATNNELGFDYLRDNMAFSSDQKVQRDRNFAIVDEVDSILIDEARTPLIISGPADETPQLYVRINQLVPNLTPAEIIDEEEKTYGEGDFTIDEKQKQVYLTEDGMATDFVGTLHILPPR